MKELKVKSGQKPSNRLTVEGKAHHGQDWMAEPKSFRAVFSDQDLDWIRMGAALLSLHPCARALHTCTNEISELEWETKDEVTENIICTGLCLNNHGFKVEWKNRHNFDFRILSEDIPYRKVGIKSPWEIKNNK